MVVVDDRWLACCCCPPQAEQLEVMRGVLWREEGHRDVQDAKALLRHVSLWKAAGARPQDVDPALCLTK